MLSRNYRLSLSNSSYLTMLRPHSWARLRRRLFWPPGQRLLHLQPRRLCTLFLHGLLQDLQCNCKSYLRADQLDSTCLAKWISPRLRVSWRGRKGAPIGKFSLHFIAGGFNKSHSRLQYKGFQIHVQQEPIPNFHLKSSSDERNCKHNLPNKLLNAGRLRQLRLNILRRCWACILRGECLRPKYLELRHQRLFWLSKLCWTYKLC